MYRGRVGSDITGVWTTYLVGVIVCLLAYRLGVEIRVPIQDTTVDWNLFEETCWAEQERKRRGRRKNRRSRAFGLWCTCSRVGGEGEDSLRLRRASQSALEI